MFLKQKISSTLIGIMRISIHKSSVYSLKMMRKKFKRLFLSSLVIYSLKTFQEYSLTPALENNTEISEFLQVIVLYFTLHWPS